MKKINELIENIAEAIKDFNEENNGILVSSVLLLENGVFVKYVWDGEKFHRIEVNDGIR